MSKADTGGPAFPTNENNFRRDYSGAGMTIRDYFAAAALQGLLADPITRADDGEKIEDFRNEIAEVCYEYADAMLEARKS